MDIKKEFQRVFEFVVKHGPKQERTNAEIKKFLLWAWERKHLLVLYDGFFEARRIAAIAICWQTDHPENKYQNLSTYDLNEGEYLSVYGVVVHPEYRDKGCLLMLLIQAMGQYPEAKKIFFNKHGRGAIGLRIMDINQFANRLLKGAEKANGIIRG